MVKTVSSTDKIVKIDNGDGTWKTLTVKDLWELMKSKLPLSFSDADLTG